MKWFLLKLIAGKDIVIINAKIINGTLYIDNNDKHAFLYNVYVENK